MLPATDVVNVVAQIFRESQRFTAQTAIVRSCALPVYDTRLWEISTNLAILFFERLFSFLAFLRSGSCMSLRTITSPGPIGSGTTMQSVAINVVIRLNEETSLHGALDTGIRAPASLYVTNPCLY